VIELEQRQEVGGLERGTPLHILSPELKQQYDALRILLQRSLWLAEKCADDEATQILRNRLTNLQAAALIVIVGEVKAGKSSFVNALVREDVCPVAPGPCTAAIQELVYGPERSIANVGRSWERVYLPKEVLREVSIVDTPGTNSIIQDHQTLTEKYIPQSDLIVFVFSAVNPHTHSAWELLTLVRKRWHRKMVFVLQQADRASQDELNTNREHVRQYARDRHVTDPTIFTLSAKQEMEGRPEGGFGEFRHYLQNAIARGEVWRMKVEGSYETIRGVMEKLLARLHAEREGIAEERAFYQELLHKVEVRETKANALKKMIIRDISATYDHLARRSEDEFAQGLGLGKLLRRVIPFFDDKSTKTWMDDLKTRFQTSARKEIAIEARRFSEEISNEMQSLLEHLTEMIARREAGMRENATLPHAGSGLKMLDQLKAKLSRMRLNEDVVSPRMSDAPDVSRLAVAGCGLVVVGLLLSALTENPWLDMTGVIFACLGVLMVGGGLLWRRADMLREFRQKLGVSRDEFQKRLDAEFTELFEGLFYEVRQALSETIFRLDLQASHVTPVVEETFRIGETASEMLLGFQRNLAAPPLNRI
jgi:GTPase SAR1 family protein